MLKYVTEFFADIGKIAINAKNVRFGGKTEINEGMSEEERKKIEKDREEYEKVTYERYKDGYL
jgi:hypothetical protein